MLMLPYLTSVFDSDGEFLLIEAADELPSWVTPTNAENRVCSSSFIIYCTPDPDKTLGLDP